MSVNGNPVGPLNEAYAKKIGASLQPGFKSESQLAAANTQQLLQKHGRVINSPQATVKAYDMINSRPDIRMNYFIGQGIYYGLANEGMGLVTVKAFKYTLQGVNYALKESSIAGKIWSLKPFERGVAIEKMMGQNLPGNFPVIDKFENGVATSIKSLDLGAKSYQNASNLTSTLKGYINSVAKFNGKAWAGAEVKGAEIAERSLDLVVPNAGTQAQQGALKAATEYGKSQGVNVNITILK